MDQKNYQRAKELFLAAVELPKSERSGFLDEACARDEALRTEVASMLADHERAAEGPNETVAVPRGKSRLHPQSKGR